jgi:hypothetical protein
LSSSKLLHTLKLSNGLTVSIYDQTKVYFGDYHHVRIIIVCSFNGTADNSVFCSPDDIELRSISYRRTLEKMGVQSKDIESVKKSLLNDFHKNSLPYISSQEFPKKMITSELANKKHPVRKYAGSGS